MANKKAYVIMPYAKHFNRLYGIIIKRAVEEMGYECVREDMTGQNGHILRNVIRGLAESDLVIADLTSLNWNVAYELGIRHAMNARGTILMCETEQKEQQGMPFDIQHMSVVFYPSDWLVSESEDKIIADIHKQIEAIENGGTAEYDSPVHELYPQLPDKLLAATDGANTEKLERRIRELEDANTQLRDRVEKAGLDEQAQTRKQGDIAAIFREAVSNSIYYSDDAVARLRELENKGEKQEFAEFLAQVLEKGFLDEQDCRNVYIICRRLGVPMLTKAYLEQAVQLYPDNEELNTFLARELSKSYQTRDRALLIANEMIGLTKKNGRYELAPKRVTRSTLGAFFDVYLELKNHAEILQIAPLLLEKYGKLDYQCLIRRNMVTAHLALDQTREALAVGAKLLELNNQADLNHYSMYRAYRDDGQLAEAYHQMECCIHLSPKDEDYYYYAAAFICDEGYARQSAEEAPGPIDPRDTKRYAVPFVLYALEMNHKNYRRAVDFLNRADFDDIVTRLVPVLQNNGNLLEEFDDFDFSQVFHCFEMDV